MTHYAKRVSDDMVIAEGNSVIECSNNAFDIMPYEVGVAPYYIISGNGVTSCSNCNGTGSHDMGHGDIYECNSCNGFGVK